MITFPATFSFEGKDYEASVHEIPHPDSQLQVSILEESLIDRFGETFVFMFTPHPDEFSFSEPEAPGGKNFMMALLAGVKKYLGEKNANRV